jgi:hypothetical protein
LVKIAVGMTMTVQKKRRAFLGAGFIALVPVAAVFGNQASAQTADLTRARSMTPLIDALRQTKKAVCIQVAAQLEAGNKTPDSYALHLRRAMLGRADAEKIGAALIQVHRDPTLKLHSFSASYNPDIQSEGAIAILESLPDDLTELGLVGCDLGEEVGRHVASFVDRSSSLKMLCVEDNRFSSAVKASIRSAARAHADCVVIV